MRLPFNIINLCYNYAFYECNTTLNMNIISSLTKLHQSQAL